MCIVNETVQDGFCDRRIGEADMPIRYRDLRNDHRRGMTITIVQYLQKVLCLADRKGISHQFIENEKIRMAQNR